VGAELHHAESENIFFVGIVACLGVVLGSYIVATVGG
jgi:hypothetical protein